MEQHRILIVDDDPRYVDLLQFTLESEGFVVCTALNAAAGMEQALTSHPDVIVTDVAMPEMDGYTLAAGLKSDPRTMEIPLMFITARGHESDRRTGQHVGAAEYLTKPFSVIELIKRIRSLCSTAAESDL
jgi:DNA-binding response OmpR family regulator